MAIGLLVTGDKGHLACGTLRKVLGNILSDPSSEKFHKLRMLNPKIQETITGVPGGLELLIAAGFDIVFEDSSDGNEEGWAVWCPGDDSLESLKCCMDALDRSFPLQAVHQSVAAAPLPATPPQSSATAIGESNPRSGAASAVVDRCTRVYLPHVNPAAQQVIRLCFGHALSHSHAGIAA